MLGKIILTIIYTIVFLIVINETWKNDIDIFRSIKKYAFSIIPLATKFEEPKLKYKVDFIPQQISEGVGVYGIQWKQDYEEYRLFIRNTSEKSEIKDLRIRLELLDGIVKAEVNQHSGTDNISFSQDNSPSGIYQNNKLVKVTKEYYNTLLVNASKLFPHGYFEIRIIAKTHINEIDNHPGYFEINYRFDDEEQTKSNRIAHDILRNNNNPKEIYIDTSREVQDQKERLHSFSITFDEPLSLPPKQKDKD